MSFFHEKSIDDFKPHDSGNASMTDVFRAAPEPRTQMDVYRILAPTAGVRVSPLCFGAMALGDQWTGFMGRAVGKEAGFKLLDDFYEAGGNFIDTANNYQDEQSEYMIGEWMKQRNNRDSIVLATKYTTPYRLRQGDSEPGQLAINFAGNSKKSLKHSLDASLRKLQTDYIDILYIHWWDHSTSIPELMQSLNDVVRSGKALYLGVSDTPAWIVSAANEYARAHGFAQFVVYQGQWNLAMRDMERDIIPMARHYGMAIAPWGALGGGRFKTPEEIEAGGKLRGGSDLSENEKAAGKALGEIAKELNVGLTSVALAWTRAKVAYCFPIVGGSNPKHLKDNIDALDIKLTPEQVKRLDDACPFNPGFPLAHFGSDPHYLPGGKPNGFFLDVSGQMKYVEQP